ncbi:S8 family serine peptidase [Hamadaea tsunoensis]|uniref:S8 family serine peptidase n=1 Tax=Hamadaea tsunoensis TaxID=53368 RepID=UPI00041C08E6|nr:S8 family serine peptidase [Hamadaea tsunoensis]
MTSLRGTPTNTPATAWPRVAYAAAGLALLAALTAAAPGGGAAPPASPGQPAGPATAARTTAGTRITLVTGDVVTLDGDNADVQAGPGRAGMTFEVTRSGGHVRVIPADAGPLIARSAVDPRLFDVTALVRDGYDRLPGLPLIIGSAASPTTTADAPLLRDVPGLTGRQALPAAKATAVRQDRAHAADSWRAWESRLGTQHAPAVSLDALRHTTSGTGVDQVGAPAAWAAGYTGTGVTVAVLDSGIDGNHPDLAGQVAEHVNFTEGEEADGDFAGHGTHVAATIAGTGAASNGTYKGVAPGAKLLDGKVCTQYGCLESWIVAGMTWAATRAKIVNLSLGGMDTDGLDPVETAVQTLSAQYGTLFVVAAGNGDGPTEGAISSPGTAPAALTVGAVDGTDALAYFSRRGPGPDGTIKPEITAPGVAITSARSADSGLPGDAYTQLSGTSMATPHVAGGAALLAQQHPTWSGQALKAALMSAALPNSTLSVYAQGGGRLDVARAVRQNVTSTTPGVSFGFRPWPHTADPVTSASVAYHNDGAQPVTLTLAMTGAPAGLFTLGTSTVTVPAGGDATVAVTADTRTGPDGHLGGWLTATAGDTVVRTPVAVDKEVESYTVTLVHHDRSGGTPSFYGTQMALRNSDVEAPGVWGPDPGDTETLRLPRGHYSLTSYMGHSGDGPKGDQTGAYSVLMGQPDIDVSHDQTIVLDARTAQPVSVTVPRADAAQAYGAVAAYDRRPHGTAGSAVISNSFASVYTGQIAPAPLDNGFISILYGQWARPGADSPYVYALTFPEPGRLVTGYQRAVTDAGLARVDADFTRVRPGTTGWKRIRPSVPAWGVGAFGPDLAFDLPFTRTEYYSPDPDTAFAGDFIEAASDTGDATRVTQGDYGTYAAGHAYREHWNRPVFGPGLGAGTGQGVVREGDTLTVDVPLYADGDGRPGSAVTSTLTATLTRDGTPVAITPGETGFTAALPPGSAAYQVQLATESEGPLSTRTTVSWSFRSATTSGAVPLPLWWIKAAPAADLYATVPANATHTLTVSAVPQAGSTPGRLLATVTEVSFDDGRTWRAAALSGGCAQVRTPAGTGFVSVRVTAADSAGNTVRETVVRAYRFA